MYCASGGKIEPVASLINAYLKGLRTHHRQSFARSNGIRAEGSQPQRHLRPGGLTPNPMPFEVSNIRHYPGHIAVV
jgi:hypothetical protein